MRVVQLRKGSGVKIFDAMGGSSNRLETTRMEMKNDVKIYGKRNRKLNQQLGVYGDHVTFV